MRRFKLIRLRRQIFQIRNGGVRGLTLKLFALTSSQQTFFAKLLFLTFLKPAKFLIESLSSSVRIENKQLMEILPKSLVNNPTIQNDEVNQAVIFGKNLRDQELFARERKVYEDLARKYPYEIKAFSLLGASKYLDGDILGWKNAYQSILAISAEESDRRFGSGQKIRVLGVDWTGPMGHLAQIDAVIKLSKLGLLSPERRIIVTNLTQIANPTLLDLWSEHIDVFRLQTEAYSRVERHFWPIFEQVPYLKCASGGLDQTTAWSNANSLWEKAGNQPLLKVSASIEMRAQKILRSWGLDESSWFVGLHVREGEHSLRRQLPNSKIHSYIPAIRRINELGGFVIRMGNPKMTPLPKIDGLIDYAHSVQRVDWMDIYLWGKSRFFMGTNSGGSDVSQVFGVPIIKSNFSHIGQSFYSPGSFMLPKLFKLKDQGRLLSLSEVLSSPFGWTVSPVHNGMDIEVIDNEPDDLVDAVNEMHHSLQVSNSGLNFVKSSELSAQADAIRSRYGALGTLPIGSSFLSKYRDFIK